MTQKDRKHYAKKHSPGRKVNPEIANVLKDKASREEISCAAAFKIARDLKVLAEEIGFTLDFLEIPITKCQLGLFGYRPEKRIVKPAATVSQALGDAIQQTLENEKLPCAAAWRIAEKLSLPKMEVSSASEALKIKISSCQLGAF